MSEKEIYHHIENNSDFKGLKVNAGIPQPESVNHESVKRFLNKSRNLLPVNDYVNGILNGDITLLSKAVTLVESANAKHQQLAQDTDFSLTLAQNITKNTLPTYSYLRRLGQHHKITKKSAVMETLMVEILSRLNLLHYYIYGFKKSR